MLPPRGQKSKSVIAGLSKSLPILICKMMNIFTGNQRLITNMLQVLSFQYILKENSVFHNQDLIFIIFAISLDHNISVINLFANSGDRTRYKVFVSVWPDIRVHVPSLGIISVGPLPLLPELLTSCLVYLFIFWASV